MRQSLDQTQGSISELLSWHICLLLFCLCLADTWHLRCPTTWIWAPPMFWISACWICPVPLHPPTSSPCLFVSDNHAPFLSAQHFSTWNLQGEPCTQGRPQWQLETKVLLICEAEMCVCNATSTSPYIQYKSFSPLLVNEQVTGYLLIMSSSSLPRFSGWLAMCNLIY